MNILLLSWNYPPRTGGIEKVIFGLHRGLRGLGDRITVITSRAENDSRRSEEYPPVLRAPRRGVPGFLLHALARGLGICARHPPDVILCGSLLTLPVGLVLARPFRIPLCLIVYGSDLLQGGKLLQAGLRWWLRRADRIVAISRATASLLRQRGVPPQRIAVIPPGIEPARWEAAPRGGGFQKWEQELQGRRVILSAGRLVRRKGFLELVREVMPEVVRRYPEVLLLIVGTDPAASLIHRERISDEIRAAVEELDLQYHVRLLGHVPGALLRFLMMRSELFALPVRSIPGDMEGFGIVFLEAALCGVPSVSTRVGGVPDAVEHGVTGWLVDPQDIRGFSEAVCRLLADAEKRKRFGEAARKRAREKFNWERLARAYHDTLAAVIQAHSRKRGGTSHG